MYSHTLIHEETTKNGLRSLSSHASVCVRVYIYYSRCSFDMSTACARRIKHTCRTENSQRAGATAAYHAEYKARPAVLRAGRGGSFVLWNIVAADRGEGAGGRGG